MPRIRSIALLLSASWLGVAAIVVGPLGLTVTAQAQSSSRDEQSDRYGNSSEGNRREERGESRRGRFGSGDRSGDWRSRRDRDDDERGDEARSDRASNAASSGASSRSTTTSTSGSTSMNMTDYAKSLVKQHDKNGDMMLDATEQGGLRGRAAAADANSDKVITVDELVVQLSGSATATTSRAAPGTVERATDNRRDNEPAVDGDSQRVFTGSAGGSSARSKETDKRRSYRFAPPSERLPTGLPSWFKSRDKNGDGQVAMSEYGRTWSSRLVDEFRRYDTNDDGIITPKEVAK
jgi:hypothetical protein